MTTIKLRRGTAAQWASANPILSTGEPAYESDTGRIKTGDGVTHYVDLPAFAPGASYTDEMAQDAVATAIANGAAASAAGGITATYDDTANAISLTLALAYAGEVAQDAVAAMIAAGTLTGITATYDDVNNKMSFAVTGGGYTDENARDAVGAAMRGGTGVSIVVDDPNDTITVKVSQTFRGEWAADTIAFTDSFSSAPANPPYTTGGSTSYSGSGGPNGTYPTYFNVGGGFNTGGSLSMDTSQIPALAGKTISKISFWSQTYSYTDSTAGSLFSANGTSKATFPYTGAGNTSGWTDNTITIGLVNPVLLWFANKVNIRVAGVRVYVTADPYMLGHVVMYSGVMYRSVIDNNASVPGADGNWVIVPITGSFRYRGAFAAGTTYNIGEVVSLGNRLYHCYANGTTAAPAPVGSNYKTRFANGVPADSLWAYSGGSTHFTQLGTNNFTYGADLEGAQSALAIRGLGSASSVQYAELTLTFTSAGTIKFADVVSSEATNDVGMFSIDGASQHTSSGNANSWTARSYAVASGTHTFRWTYTKNGSVDTGFDAYMVTNIKTTNSSVSLNGWTQIGYTSISQQDIQDFDGDMHVIGASGEPAFQNSWAQSTVSVSNFEPVGFWKRADGHVELKGVVSGGSANTTVFTLPAGFRPAKNRVLPCVAIGGTWGAGACLVNTDGTVNLVVIGTGGGAATSMDGVSFLAEQ